MPMPTRTALPPNANFGLSDWSYWCSGLIYVSRPEYFKAKTRHRPAKPSPNTFSERKMKLEAGN